MKYYFYTGLLALTLTACTSTSKTEARNEVRTDAEQTRARTTMTKDEYQRKLEARLDRIDREMDEERARAEKRKMDAKARREYNERMEDLRKLRADTRSKWDEMKNATADGWEKFKDGVDNSVDRLDRAWDRFKADMKS
jgi:hypothetical protein